MQTELLNNVLVLHEAIPDTKAILERFKSSPVGRGYSKTEIQQFGGGGSETFSLFVVSEGSATEYAKLIENGTHTPKEDDNFYEDLLKLDRSIWKSFFRYIESYQLTEKIKTPNRLGYSMRHYVPGSFVGPHSDYKDGNPNQLSITLNIYMNSDFEGGEIVFYEGVGDGVDVGPNTPFAAKYKPSAGDIVIFPSNMIHRVEPITSGERYNINALFIEPEKPTWYVRS